MVEGLEPKLLEGVVVFVRTRLVLLLLPRLLPVLLRLQRNRVGSCSGLEFDIAIGTGAVARVAGLAEFELGTGLEIGLDTGMVGLLW